MLCVNLELHLNCEIMTAYYVHWFYAWITHRCGVLFGWLLCFCLILQCAVWVEGATEAGLPHNPNHTLRPPSQHQWQFLPAHLRHLSPGAWEPATRRPGCHRHLHHYPKQGRDASPHLLQGGEESKQQHGERETYTKVCASALKHYWLYFLYLSQFCLVWCFSRLHISSSCTWATIHQQ